MKQRFHVTLVIPSRKGSFRQDFGQMDFGSYVEGVLLKKQHGYTIVQMIGDIDGRYEFGQTIMVNHSTKLSPVKVSEIIKSIPELNPEINVMVTQ